jgi:hypothetical protein
MKHRPKDMDQRKFIDDIRGKQENILWPDTVRNSRSVDAYLWKGSPSAPLVQRIGAWLFGLCFFVLGLRELIVSIQLRDWLFILLSVGSIFLGTRIFINGCKKKKRSMKP